MAKRKFKICVGACGPTLLYTNIIKAEDERDAVIQYLSSDGNTPTEEEVQRYISYTHEVVPTPKRKDDEPIVDTLGKPFAIGDKAAFIRNTAPSFVVGEVTKINNSSVVIKTSDGRENRVTCSKGSFCVEYAVILNDRIKRNGDKQDATGYPVLVDDKVLFVRDVYGNISLVQGTIKDIKNTRVSVEYTFGKRPEQTYKTFAKIVVL